MMISAHIEGIRTPYVDRRECVCVYTRALLVCGRRSSAAVSIGKWDFNHHNNTSSNTRTHIALRSHAFTYVKQRHMYADVQAQVFWLWMCERT